MEKWFEWIISRVFQLMHNTERDNFDFRRYDHPESVFHFDFHVSYFLFFEKHRSELFAARSLLADQASRDLFDWLILFRILGHLHVRLPFNRPETRGYDETVGKWRVADTRYECVLGPLSTFDIPAKEDSIRLNCCPGNVAANTMFSQYRFRRDGICVAPDSGDHVVDAGACFGDTALFFAFEVGPSGHVYAFEPMPRHCEIIRENLTMNPALAPRITIFPYGLSDRMVDVVASRDDIVPGVRLGDELPARTLDSFDIAHQ